MGYLELLYFAYATSWSDYPRWNVDKALNNWVWSVYKMEIKKLRKNVKSYVRFEQNQFQYQFIWKSALLFEKLLAVGGFFEQNFVHTTVNNFFIDVI